MADRFNWQDRVVVVTGSGGETERFIGHAGHGADVGRIASQVV